MKGNIVKRDKGDWVVWWTDPTAENGLRILPLYPNDVKQIEEWSKVFDNIEGRINSSPEVEFEIIPCIPPNLEPTRGETLSFEAIKYAKLIHRV